MRWSPAHHPDNDRKSGRALTSAPVLWFDREVVAVLTRSQDPAVRSAVEAFVDGSLRDKPEYVRLGLAGESLLLGGYVAALRALGRLDGGDALRRRLHDWERSRIGVLRQYVRALRALVVFAEAELAPATAG